MMLYHTEANDVFAIRCKSSYCGLSLPLGRFQIIQWVTAIMGYFILTWHKVSDAF